MANITVEESYKNGFIDGARIAGGVLGVEVTNEAAELMFERMDEVVYNLFVRKMESENGNKESSGTESKE